jgi:hypothetical protein
VCEVPSNVLAGMGIGIGAWRARIGTFAMPGARDRFVAPAILIGVRLRLALKLLTVFSALLLVAGDVESNPGPPPRIHSTRSLSQSRISFEASINDRDSTSYLL